MRTTRWLRSGVLFAVAILILAQAVVTSMQIESARKAALASAGSTAARISRAVESTINRNFVQLDAMLAGLPAILAPYATPQGFDAESANRVLREIANQNFTFRDVLLVRANGMPAAAGLPVSRRRPLPFALGPAFFEPGRSTGGMAIAGPVRNPATGEWSLFLARAIAVAGLGPVTAVAEVPVPLISTLLSMGGDAPGLRVTLEREDGLLLAAHPHEETRLGQRFDPPLPALVAEHITPGRAGAGTALISVRPTLYPALLVAATIDMRDALAAWERDRQQDTFLALGISALVLALGFALLIGFRQRERIDAERAVWRAQLENALESMSDGFVMFGPDDRMVACNERYRNFYAISAPFIKVGAHFRDIMREGAVRGQYPQAGADIEAFVNAMDYWRHANNPPIERLLPDGRWVLITERSTADGGTVGIRTDITKLKRAMEELAAARDAARAAGEAKSQFLARMSHELRTPLNGILGFAQVLLRDPRLSPDQREQVQTLNDAGQHLLELVNTLLDLSKVEAGKLELSLRDVALRPLLEACAGLLAPEVERKRHRFVLDIAPGTPAAVEVDPMRLRQMLLNLLSNAVKFTPAGGRVELRAKPLPDGARGIRIEVQDSGPGIPASKQHLLFEDFSQLGAQPGLEGAGTGLGLAISARLATAMGGRIGCAAGAPGGALFWVELPLRDVPLPAPVPAPVVVPGTASAFPRAAHGGAPGAPPADGGRVLRVLVVDDVAANRMVARAMLSAAGHRVETAADGIEAVAAVQREAYDVVLMDVQMPLVDGLEATRRIRALDGPQARVPILAVTASALPEQVEVCHAAGMDGHVSKPVDRDLLLATVARLAAGRAPGLPPQGSAEPSAEVVLIEPSALTRLAADLGPSAGSVIREFKAELSAGLDALREAGIADDPGQLRHAAHRLLGAAHTLGARRLASVVEALQGANQGGADIARALRDVLDVGAVTVTALDQPQPDGPPAAVASMAPQDLAG
jgi:signal transduction histidine kinase/DNA-binding NarL/FixJ family response regulator